MGPIFTGSAGATSGVLGVARGIAAVGVVLLVGTLLGIFSCSRPQAKPKQLTNAALRKACFIGASMR